MRALVCGGRGFCDLLTLIHMLDRLHEASTVDLLIEGGAQGADRMAREWAERNGIPVKTFNADWKTYGRAAGHIRNRQMLEEGLPDIVVAFPGGRGTENMVTQAKRASVRVWRPIREQLSLEQQT